MCSVLRYNGFSFTLLVVPMEQPLTDGITLDAFETSFETVHGKMFLNANASVLFVEPGQLASTPAGSLIFTTHYESCSKNTTARFICCVHTPLGNKFSESCPHFVKAAVTSHNIATLDQKTGPMWTARREFFDVAF